MTVPRATHGFPIGPGENRVWRKGCQFAGPCARIAFPWSIRCESRGRKAARGRPLTAALAGPGRPAKRRRRRLQTDGGRISTHRPSEACDHPEALDPSEATVPTMTALTERAVLEALSQVQEPELSGDLVSRNMIKDLAIDGARVAFTIELTTPACPLKDEIEANVGRVLKPLGAETIDVSWGA